MSRRVQHPEAGDSIVEWSAVEASASKAYPKLSAYCSSAFSIQTRQRVCVQIVLSLSPSQRHALAQKDESFERQRNASQRVCSPRGRVIIDPGLEKAKSVLPSGFRLSSWSPLSMSSALARAMAVEEAKAYRTVESMPCAHSLSRLPVPRNLVIARLPFGRLSRQSFRSLRAHIVVAAVGGNAQALSTTGGRAYRCIGTACLRS